MEIPVQIVFRYYLAKTVLMAQNVFPVAAEYHPVKRDIPSVQTDSPVNVPAQPSQMAMSVAR